MFPFFDGGGPWFSKRGEKTPVPLHRKSGWLRGEKELAARGTVAARNGKGKTAMNENNCVIFAYTRKQALADGVLVDVSTRAEAGFSVPVALHERCVGVRASPGRRGGAECYRATLGRAEHAPLRHQAGPWERPRGAVPRVSGERPAGESHVSSRPSSAQIDNGAPCLTVMLPHRRLKEFGK